MVIETGFVFARNSIDFLHREPLLQLHMVFLDSWAPAMLEGKHYPAVELIFQITRGFINEVTACTKFSKY